jgi:probable rRNA maturation factor
MTVARGLPCTALDSTFCLRVHPSPAAPSKDASPIRNQRNNTEHRTQNTNVELKAGIDDSRGMQFNLIIMSLLLRYTSSFVARSGPSFARQSTAGFSSTPAEIEFSNEQTALPGIDEEKLRQTVSRIRSILGYDHYAVSLSLIGDEDMQAINLETRNVDAPTDILSFQFHEAVKPGLLEKPEFDIPDYYNLGDLLIDVPYVIRGVEEDSKWEYEEDDERGVSVAMMNVLDTEQRLHMLLIHGMLHLVGYDHIEDDDCELMVAREDEILKELDLMPEANPKP